MTTDTTEIRSQDLRELTQRPDPGGIRESADQQPEPPEIDFSKEGDLDKTSNLKELSSEFSERRKARLDAEKSERESYERAAGLGELGREHELPDLSKTDAELSAEDVAELRRSVESLKTERASFEDMEAQRQAYEQQQQAAQNYQAANQQLGEYGNYLHQVLTQEVQTLREEFPEYQINSVQDLVNIGHQDPYFAGRVQAADQRCKAAQFEAQQAVHQYDQAFAQAAQPHDAAFDKAHPELADPKARQSVRAGVVNMLKSAGYSEADLVNGWTRGAGPLSNIRDHRVQNALLEQFRVSEAKARIASSKFKPAPAQRPGNFSDRGSSSEAELRKLDKELTKTGSIRAASALLLAKERYRKGR